MSSTPLMASSNGAITLFCKGLRTGADSKLVHTMMVGGAMSGYCSTGKENNPMMPTTTIVMEMTADSTGRSIKVLGFV